MRITEGHTLLEFCRGFLTYACLVINSIFCPFPFSREWWRGTKNSKFLMTSPHPGAIQESIWSCLIKSKDTPSCNLEMTKFRSPVRQSSNTNIRTVYTLSVLIVVFLGNYKGFGSSVPETGGRDKCIFSISAIIQTL